VGLERVELARLERERGIDLEHRALYRIGKLDELDIHRRDPGLGLLEVLSEIRVGLEDLSETGDVEAGLVRLALCDKR